MERRKKIAQIIEKKLGYTNGWRIDDEAYEVECLLIADEIINLFSLDKQNLTTKPDVCNCDTREKEHTEQELYMNSCFRCLKPLYKD